mmetsp:Transcript_29874/g.79834  ORF Transcript_29874/g.79834 Transcript_29874/m.79834 type:complete len:246 (+) Transcript_29874:783-1520(+)
MAVQQPCAAAARRDDLEARLRRERVPDDHAAELGTNDRVELVHIVPRVIHVRSLLHGPVLTAVVATVVVLCACANDLGKFRRVVPRVVHLRAHSPANRPSRVAFVLVVVRVSRKLSSAGGVVGAILADDPVELHRIVARRAHAAAKVSRWLSSAGGVVGAVLANDLVELNRVVARRIHAERTLPRVLPANDGIQFVWVVPGIVHARFGASSCSVARVLALALLLAAGEVHARPPRGPAAAQARSS